MRRGHRSDRSGGFWIVLFLPSFLAAPKSDPSRWNQMKADEGGSLYPQPLAFGQRGLPREAESLLGRGKELVVETFLTGRGKIRERRE
jgi:hypothetical protein